MERRNIAKKMQKTRHSFKQFHDYVPKIFFCPWKMFVWYGNVYAVRAIQTWAEGSKHMKIVTRLREPSVLFILALHLVLGFSFRRNSAGQA